ncbi:unnamed protein product [Symbiodinium sp. KB8]|nr:unnamed protein product [Symbiodinium sp. KB8]
MSLLATPGAGCHQKMITGGPRIHTSSLPAEGCLSSKSMPMTVTQIRLPGGLLSFEPGQVSGESPASATTSSKFSPLSRLPQSSKSFFTASATEKLQLHQAGQCYPCVAFAFKAAGCYKGESCSHCHFCTASEATARRRQLQAAARQQKKKQRPTDQWTETTDQGTETTARILAGESLWL